MSSTRRTGPGPPATVQSINPPFSFLASLKSRRLSMRLLAAIGCCSLLCILLAIAFQLSTEYRRDLAGIESRLQFIESSYVPALTAGAYQMDEEQIRLQLRGVLQLQDIVSARVIRGFESMLQRLIGESITVQAGSIRRRS